ncbi:hypothetical protein OIU76_002124 [Salix suchowensis]|uniref:Uncharacterized protein n=1 Tax=Salix suchowensis TaxID=1278906 RepID=A0ABQ9CK02_9ROSI|nr:hypothetical protein OIU76_002124 [Salix suchowensis]KAJ6398608.1 hypothetical protein OIU77_019402 [Salix suchowensis]
MTNPEASEPDADVVVFGEPSNDHQYTWFRGSSMSRIDRACASPACHLHFAAMTLSRYPGGSRFDHFSWLLVRIESLEIGVVGAAEQNPTARTGGGGIGT